MNLQVIKSLKPISLEEINKVKLMKRVDKKFMVPDNCLSDLFQSIRNNYYMLEINTSRLMEYVTVYFDTNDNQLYINHHNGKLNRYKIRKRMYIETGVCFLEIKFKNNKGTTQKERVLTHSNMFELSEADITFLNSKTPYDACLLKPKIANSFKRITLANINYSERCTIDCNISFESNNKNGNFENLAIIEVKQDAYNSDSILIKKLNELRIKPKGFSKYCMGRALTEQNIKKNAFKAKLREIKKLTYNLN